MVNKREMRRRISRGRREQIERERLSRVAQFQHEGLTIFEMTEQLQVSVSEVKRLVRKLNKINMMPTTLPQRLKEKAGA